MNFHNLIIILFIISISTICNGQLVNTAAELEDAIDDAVPGSTIVLADGTWNDVYIDIDKNGNASNPITIKAQNAGAVFMTGNSRVYMDGSYITVSGLVFKDPSNLVVSGDNIKPVFELKTCDYCKVLNNKIENYNGTESQ